MNATAAVEDVEDLVSGAWDDSAEKQHTGNSYEVVNQECGSAPTWPC